MVMVMPRLKQKLSQGFVIPLHKIIIFTKYYCYSFIFQKCYEMLYKRKDMKASDIHESAMDEDVVSNLEMENIENTEKLGEKTGNDEEPRYKL